MPVRPIRLFPLILALLLAVPPQAEARGLLLGGVGQEGTAVAELGVPELSLGSRFVPTQPLGGTPTLGLRVGSWSGGSLGLAYSRTGIMLGNPHELEFSVKQRLFSEQRGDPLSATLQGAVNTGAYSLDGELALSRNFGPLTMLGTARLLGNAEGARMPFGGFGLGAQLDLSPGLALLGDVFQVANGAATLPAWGAGVRMRFPAIPYAVSVFLTNTASTTRQGSSLGTPDLRLGVDLGMTFAGRPQGRKLPSEPVMSAEALHAENSRLREPPDLRSEVAAPDKASRGQAASAAQPEPTPKPSVNSRPVMPVMTPKPLMTPKPASRAKPRGQAAKKPVASLVRPKVQPTKKPVRQAGAVAESRRESELWIVMIRDGEPTPTRIQLRRGSSVTWFNRDAVPHAWSGRGWGTEALEAGKQVTRRFEQTGTFPYHCRLHPGEGGTITVR